MLRKLRGATAVVSVLLVTITVTLTLTLTASATATAIATETATVIAAATGTSIDERTTTLTGATFGNVETTAVISKRQEEGNETATTAAAETTTTTFLTLQPPPFNLTSPTTSSYEPESKLESKSESATAAPTPTPTATAAVLNFKNVTAAETTSSPTKNSINHEIDKANNVAVKSDTKEGDKGLQSNNKSQAEEEMKAIEQQIPKELIKLLRDEASHTSQSSPMLPELMLPQKFQPTHITTPKGYINFDPKDPIELTARQKQQKTQTVNEVLTSLFPNGFSDIFRFSYASEEATTTSVPVSDATNIETTATPTPTTTTSTSTPLKPSVRFTTSVSKEYRRLISPGHTEIVVENLAIPSSSSEEFNDGSNSISRDDLLRINRAAVEAPVLPSLLVEPSKENETGTSTAPTVILKENSSENDDLIDETDDDNLIAESQDISQHVLQRLPDANTKLNYKNKAPEVNVEIIHDDTLKPTKLKGIFGQRLFTPAAELPKKELLTRGAFSTPKEFTNGQQNLNEQDHFQEHAEQTFKEPNSAPEAPSRKFLKHFNPQLSEATSGLVKKGQFHYESIGRQQRLQSSAAATNGNYADLYVKPAAQLQYQRQYKQPQQNQPQEQQQQQSHQQQSQQQQPQQQQTQNQQTDDMKLHTHIIGSQPVTGKPADYKGYEATPIQENSSPDSKTPSYNIFFVTVNTQRPNITPKPTPLPLLAPNLPDKTPHDYVAESIGAASQTTPQRIEEPKKSEGYTYVEVQKSVNIHNKLITEKDGQLVEQHETIYPQPPYTQNEQQNAPLTPKDYVSLSANPINVQHIDEPHEEAASQTAAHEVQPPPVVQQTQVQYVEKLVPQPYPVEVEKIVDRPYPVTKVVEKPVPAPYPVKEYVEKVVDRPVEVEKIIDRPVKVPYPVHVNHYIDRPYPVHEIIEQPVAVPYAVPEPVAVPVPFETFIDRPYPVETIVEKRVPYPVEKVVEKIVEKHVPVEVERIVEKPKIVEKVVEKLVDRPIGIPIHVPVAVPYASHPNSLHWNEESVTPPPHYKTIPPEVLQNYYTRVLKKLLGPKPLNIQILGHTSAAPVASTPHYISSTKTTKPTQPKEPIQFTKPPFKISDIRYDLKPPPPPLGPSWYKGARYIYNTLPAHLTTALVSDQDFGPQQQILFIGAAPQTQTKPDVSLDEFQRWRNGHLLKRSPDFGRNLHIEYGFKPPLVPSLEIDEKGMPLKSSVAKTDE